VSPPSTSVNTRKAPAGHRGRRPLVDRKHREYSAPSTTMRIEKIQMTQVGPFDHAELTIPEPEGEGEIILFEGPNGSGKTTLVRGICALLELFYEGALGQENWGAVSGRRRGPNSIIASTFHGLEGPNQTTKLERTRARPISSTARQTKSRF